MSNEIPAVWKVWLVKLTLMGRLRVRWHRLRVFPYQPCTHGWRYLVKLADLPPMTYTDYSGELVFYYSRGVPPATPVNITTGTLLDALQQYAEIGSWDEIGSDYVHQMIVGTADEQREDPVVRVHLP